MFCTIMFKAIVFMIILKNLVYRHIYTVGYLKRIKIFIKKYGEIISINKIFEIPKFILI